MSVDKYLLLQLRLELEKSLDSSFLSTPAGISLKNQMRSIWMLLSEEDKQLIESKISQKDTPFDKDKYE